MPTRGDRHLRAIQLAKQLAALGARLKTIHLITGIPPRQVQALFFPDPRSIPRGRAPDSAEWYHGANLILRADACLIGAKYRQLRLQPRLLYRRHLAGHRTHAVRAPLPELRLRVHYRGRHRGTRRRLPLLQAPGTLSPGPSHPGLLPGPRHPRHDGAPAGHAGALSPAEPRERYPCRIGPVSTRHAAQTPREWSHPIPSGIAVPPCLPHQRPSLLTPPPTPVSPRCPSTSCWPAKQT